MGGKDDQVERERRRARAERMRRILGASELGATGGAPTSANAEAARFVRAEGEDDDGYDPYSDRPASRDEVEQDPWR